MKRSASGLILGLLGLFFVASLPASATSYVPVSDENLVAKAALVVRARVVLIVIDAVNQREVLVAPVCGDEHLLHATGQVRSGLITVEESSR